MSDYLICDHPRYLVDMINAWAGDVFVTSADKHINAVAE
jgi:hypothetical protein